MKRVNKKAYGFTIIELLIVIVVIGVLSSITAVAYSGIQNKALNTARHQEAMAWYGLLRTYIAQEGKIPPVPTGDYCLGTGFPDGDGITGGECRDYNSNWTTMYHENSNAGLMTELKKAGSLPHGPRRPINGTVGPYISMYANSFSLYAVFNGSQASECPSGMMYSWTDSNGRLICQIDHLINL